MTGSTQRTKVWILGAVAIWAALVWWTAPARPVHAQDKPVAADAKPQTEPAADAEPADESWREEVEYGQALVVTKCAQCHHLRRVFSVHYTPEQWKESLDRMAKLMEKDEIGMTPAEQEEIYTYLTTMDSDYKESEDEKIGKLHFILLHFPVAFLALTLLLELWVMVARIDIARDAVHLMMWISMFATVAAIVPGWYLAHQWETHPRELEWHELLGYASGAGAILCVFFRELTVITEWGLFAACYRLLLLLTNALVMVTGHIGGLLVHGEVPGGENFEPVMKLLRDWL